MTAKELIKLNTRKIKGLFYSEMYGKKLFNFGLSGLKSFFRAVTDIAWGIAGLFLMMFVLVFYHDKYNIDITMIDNNFIILLDFVRQHIFLFFVILWLYSWIINYRSLEY